LERTYSTHYGQLVSVKCFGEVRQRQNGKTGISEDIENFPR
jgi:hypothetical protein